MLSIQYFFKTKKTFLFLILPFVLFISAGLLKNVQGPYYLFFYDPSYVYLINSLNLAQFSGYGVGHFDHPGTTVQVIGAFAVKIYHAFFNLNPDLTEDVLSRPEFYLLFMNKTFVFINAFMLFLLGVFIFKITKNIYPALLIQLSAFASVEIFFGLIIVTPENFMISVCIVYIGAVFHYIFKTSINKKHEFIFIIVFAFICGVGLATKINFFPLLILPLMIFRGLKSKFIFMLSVLLFFLIFISPGLGNIEYFVNWVSGLIFKNKKYGKGESTVISSKEFFGNIILILKKDIVFTAAFLSSVAAAFILLKKKYNPGEFLYRIKTVNLAFALIFTLQILIVAKHYSQYYMIPSFMLTVSALSVSVPIIIKKFISKPTPDFQTNIFKVLFVLLISWSLYLVISSYFEGDEQRKDALEMIQKIEEKKPEGLFISSFGSSGRETALSFASQYAAGQSNRYQKFLAEKFLSNIFYNQWTDKFFLLQKEKGLKEELSKNNTIILQLSHYGSLKNFLETLKKEAGFEVGNYEKIFENQKMETLYKLYLKN